MRDVCALQVAELEWLSLRIRLRTSGNRRVRRENLECLPVLVLL